MPLPKLIVHLLLAGSGALSSRMAVPPATARVAIAAGQLRAFLMAGDMPVRVRIAAVR